MFVVRSGHRHEIPDGDTFIHNTGDGEWCACAPEVTQVPIRIAEQDGYFKSVKHADADERAARRTRLA